MPVAPLDTLAQQIVAAVACDEWHEDELYAMCRRAWPYHDLARLDFDAIISMLSEGISPSNRTGAYLHRDQINHRLRARRHARISALTSGGAIPEMADYRVVTEGEADLRWHAERRLRDRKPVWQCFSTGKYIVADPLRPRRPGDRSRRAWRPGNSPILVGRSSWTYGGTVSRVLTTARGDLGSRRANRSMPRLLGCSSKPGQKNGPPNRHPGTLRLKAPPSEWCPASGG